MKKIYLLIAFFLVIQAFFMGKGIAYGENASNIDKKISALREENGILELKIATFVSCSNIAQKAEERGFKSISLTESSDGFVSVAFKR